MNGIHVAYGVASLLFFVSGVNAQSPSLLTPPELASRVDFLAVEQGKPLSIPLPTAIEKGYLVEQAYTVEAGDTLSEILSEYRIVSDPSAVGIMQEINGGYFVPNEIRTGDKINILGIPEGQHPEISFAQIVLDGALKSKLASESRQLIDIGLDSNFDSLDPDSELASFVQTYDEIATNLAGIEEASYALDAPTLAATSDAVAKSRAIYASYLETGEFPAPEDLSFLKDVASVSADYVKAAAQFDSGRVFTEAVVQDRATGNPVPYLEVCFVPALSEINEPQGDCLDKFDTPSSPATKYFQYNLRYKVWVVDDGRPVSTALRRIHIQPNNPDNRYQFILQVQR